MLKSHTTRRTPSSMAALRARLQAAEENLDAIRRGADSAIVPQGPHGDQAFTLKGADQPYRLLIETMNEGALTLLADGTIAYSNSRFAELVKTPLDQVLGSAFERFVVPAEQAAFARVLQEALHDSARGDFTLRCNEGADILVHLSLRAPRSEDTRGVCLVVTDLSARMQAEEALRASERRYRNIVETAQEGIWAIDADNNTTFVNRKMAELLGYRVEDMIGVSLFTFMDEEGRRIAAANIERRRQGITEQHEFIFRRKDGTPIWTLFSTGPVLGEDGRYAGALAMVTNITERKRAEHALFEELGMSAAFFNHALNGFVLLDRNFNFIRVNQTYADACRRDITAFAGRNYFDLYPSDTKPIFEEAVRTKKPFRTVARPFSFPDQPERGVTYWDWTLAPILDEHGEVEILVFSLNDVTAWKRTEDELHARVRQQAAVAEIGQRALAGTDLPTLMNEAVNLVTHTLDVEYCKLLELLPGGDQLLLRTGVGWKDGYAGVATVGAGPDSQAGYTLLAREPVIVEDLRAETRFTGPPLLHEHGVISGVSVAIPGVPAPYGVLGAHSTRERSFSEDDVHFLQAVANVLAEAIQRKHAEDEIRRLNAGLEERVRRRTAELEAAMKELESFSYTVSHDLRAPLRHIEGFGQLLLKRTGASLDETSTHYVRTIAEAAIQMGRLIDDLLAFARTSRAELDVQVVQLDQLVREVRQQLLANAPSRVTWTIAPLPAVRADPALLRVVLANLLSNAIKFTASQPDPRIEIAATIGDDGETVISVRDTGVGFDMRYAHKLFGVFQRLHNQDEFEGTGIGLATVQRIIQRFGGRVWAEGEVGRGATFCFTLPASGAPGLSQHAAPSTQHFSGDADGDDGKQAHPAG